MGLFGTVFLLLVALSPADLTGIWMGEMPGRNGEKTDLAFQFQSSGGIMFGDEFDLPVEDLRIDGDHISFTVTSTDYYSGRKTKAIFTGTLSAKGLELTREQPNPDPAKASKVTLTLKKVT